MSEVEFNNQRYEIVQPPRYTPVWLYQNELSQLAYISQQKELTTSSAVIRFAIDYTARGLLQSEQQKPASRTTRKRKTRKGKDNG
jgi:hypothetical protein